MTAFVCRKCGRPCATNPGLAAHERAHDDTARPRLSTTTILTAAGDEPLGQWRRLWVTGLFGTRDGSKLRGALPLDTGCVGTPDGRVVPSGRAA